MRELTQQDRQDISALLDGELAPARADEVRRLIEADTAWRAAYDELRELDALLDNWQVAPPPADLNSRILAALGAPAGATLRRWLAAGAAVAASIVLAAAVWLQLPASPTAPVGAQQAQQDSAEVDALIAENVEFFQAYEVVANFETLQAIEKVEGSNVY
jgi:anti-sigma factor RsiW